ncbi:hypothetical protein AVEN_30045-1 [Araneus ventricosus]|uniref:Uncharacterized protein n=1 Tax=Araneus ventricosus TaxID=182803 RepID=A0A4Y2I7Q5_ARAVE|nr:hypothetical protein AVEN_30045-1 [Araneus ventricosus]
MPLKVEKNKLTVATLDMAQMRNAALILESEALVASTRPHNSPRLCLHNSCSHSSGVSPLVVSSGGTPFPKVVSSGGSGIRAGLPWFLQTVEVRKLS